ncbi:unnamed protein product [Ixodes hexagonus]
MDKFLSDCKKSLVNLDTFPKVHVVLGNEACDLDSAVSAIVTAYLLHELQPVKSILVVPVLNIARKDVKLRTEITYFFEQVDVPLDSVICRDEIDLGKLQSEKKLSLTLVDHNLLPKEDTELQGSVQEIIDHHRLETSHRCDKTVEMVGSCCTLVAEKVLSSKADLINPQVALLLYGTILLDTVCLSEAARKTTAKDRDVVARLQALLPELTMDEVFKSLNKAKMNVAGLTLDELLRKDLKTVCTPSKRIAISSVPGEIKDICHENSMETELGKFCEDHGYSALIILAVAVEEKNNTVQRQLAVFSSDIMLKQQLTSMLLAVGDPSLDLQVSHASTDHFITFVQGNSHASRKVVLPVVRKFLTSLEDNVLPKMNEHSSTNGSLNTLYSQQCTPASASSPEDTALRDPPFSPSDSSNSASETAKDGGTEKFHEEESLSTATLADPLTQAASLYRAETLDFPDSPLQSKHFRHKTGSCVDEETDDDALSRGDQFSISEARRANDAESQPLSLASELEEYFEDSLVSGNLAVRGLAGQPAFESSTSPGQPVSANSESLGLASDLSFSELSSDCGVKHSTPKKDDFLSSPVGKEGGPKESAVEVKVDSEDLGTEKHREDTNGFLFEERASDEVPDQDLLAKVKLCFDGNKIKDVYVLSEYLQDRLTPQEVDEIINNHSSYSGFIDDNVMDALVGMKTSGAWTELKKKDLTQEKKVIVPNLQPFSDESSDLLMTYTVDDVHQGPRKERSASKVDSVDIPDFQAGGDSEALLSLKRIAPEECFLKTLNITLGGETSASATDAVVAKSKLPSSVAPSEVLGSSLGKQPLKCLEESIESLPEPDPPELRDAEINQLTTSLQEDSDGELNHLEHRPERPTSLSGGAHHRRRKIKVNPDILRTQVNFDDDSKSLSSLSNKSDGDVFSPVDDLVTPDIDTPDEMTDSVLGREDSTLSEPIPELSAMEEYTEERSWRTINVGGVERKIDMKVIEPYKKVLSHGGYFGEERHAIIVFSACYLPDRGRRDYDYVMDNLFLYVLSTLDQLVAEDYVLIYLHGATERSIMPSFGWLKRCYQMIDRRLRKNLKGLYLVHPTFWVKTIVIMTRPFVSSKFSRKLRFVSSIEELSGLVPLDHVSIPDKVKQ